MKKFVKGKALYQYISQNSTDVDLTIKGLAGIVRCEISLDNETATEQAFDQLCTEYSSAEGFVDAVLSICGVYIKANDPALALPYINRALQAAPDSEKAISLLKIKAKCYAGMGDDVLADAILDEIAMTNTTDEEFFEILNKTADKYREQGYYEKSIELYQEVIDSNSDENQQLLAYVGTARSYFKLDDDPNVAATVDTICKDFADHKKLGWGLYVIAEDCFVKKSYNRSKELSLLVLEHAKDCSLAGESAYMVAHCARKLKDEAMQMEYYHLIMEKYPRSQFAHRVPNELGQLYRSQKNYEQAEYWFIQQRKLYKDRLFGSRATFNLGVMYTKSLRDYAKAVEVFENYKKWYPSGASIKRIPFPLADCYDKLGRKPEAIAVLNAALEKWPDIGIAKGYKKLLNKILEGAK